MSASGIKSFLAAHRAATVITALVIVGGGYYAWHAKQSKTSTETVYTLGAAEKGTLISTVSGSGQVSASDQLDVKSKASGQIIAVSVAQGQQVKAGDVLIRIDDADARKSVRDAQSSLASAQLSLEKLVAPADELSIVQAENSLTQAMRSETQAESSLVQMQASSAQTIAQANDDGYNASSQAFLDMPNQMKDLKDLRGTDVSPDANVTAFQHILGENSPLIAIWTRDHDAAIASFDRNFDFFKSVPRTADDATRYELISRSLETETAVAQALQSAHAMLDAVVNTTYKNYDVASAVDALRPKITSDISQINGDISKTQSAKDTIDDTTRNTPIDLKKAQDAIDAAKESVKEKTESLAKLKAGPDPLDVKAQQLSLQQKQNALSDAREKLADYVVRAPFDGTVAAFSLKKGDQTSSGGTVATMVTAKRFADVTLNEVDAVKTKTGDKVTLTFDAIEGLGITGEVADVATIGTVSQGVVTYAVRIQFDTQDDRVRPGMSASAAIVYDAKPDVLLVPSSAVKVSQNGGSYVLMFDAARSAGKRSITSATPPPQKAVEVGASNDTQTEITGGLSEGDVIVVKSAAAGSSSSNTNAARPTGGIGIPGLGGGNVRIQGAGGGGFRGD